MIVTVEIDLEGDGEPSLIATFPNQQRRSGEYWRGTAFKGVVNGTWPLMVIGTDALGNQAIARCLPGVTVTF